MSFWNIMTFDTFHWHTECLQRDLFISKKKHMFSFCSEKCDNWLHHPALQYHALSPVQPANMQQISSRSSKLNCSTADSWHHRLIINSGICWSHYSKQLDLILWLGSQQVPVIWVGEADNIRVHGEGQDWMAGRTGAGTGERVKTDLDYAGYYAVWMFCS